MRVYAICQDELVIRSLDDVLLPSFEVDFLVESRPLARRLHDAGIQVSAGDPRRVDTYLKADISPSTCFIVEDNGRTQRQARSCRRFAMPAARSSTCCTPGPATRRPPTS